MNSSTNTSNTSTALLTEEEMVLNTLNTVKPPLLVRQTNKPRYLTYENGILVDQDGNPTTPEQHNTTHLEILGNIRKHRHLCFIKDDEEFLALIAKYVPLFFENESSLDNLDSVFGYYPDTTDVPSNPQTPTFVPHSESGLTDASFDNNNTCKYCPSIH